MKKKVVILSLAALLLAVSPLMARSYSSVNDKGTFNLQMGVGLGVGIIENAFFSGYSGYYYIPPVTVAGNWGLHDMWSIGFITGVRGYGYTYIYSYSYLRVMLGVRGSFHFNRWIKVKNLDVYAGLTFGGYIIISYGYSSSVRPDLLWNAHVGVKYYFTNTIGIWAEAGYGYSILSLGVVFKF